MNEREGDESQMRNPTRNVEKSFETDDNVLIAYVCRECS